MENKSIWKMYELDMNNTKKKQILQFYVAIHHLSKFGQCKHDNNAKQKTLRIMQMPSCKCAGWRIFYQPVICLPLLVVVNHFNAQTLKM